MTQACDEAFLAVQELAGGHLESRGVDAFCLAWIKYERQLRKLAAYLIYQSSTLDSGDQRALRQAFLENKGISHTSARGCFWRLTHVSINALIGDRYDVLNRSLTESFRGREKIFHGQQTGANWNRNELLTRAQRIREWCALLSDASAREYGYDGFSGNTSLFKKGSEALIQRVDDAIVKSGGWVAFVASL